MPSPYSNDVEYTGICVFNVIAICDQRHANVSKQTTLLAGDDVAPPIGAA